MPQSTESKPKAPPAPRLAVQALWLMIARAIGFVCTFAMPLVIVRVFDVQQFGAYKQAFVVVGTAQQLLPFSVGVSAFYFLPRLRGRTRELIFNIVAYHVAIGLSALVVLSVWPGLLSLLVGSEVLAPRAALIGAVICTWVLSSFLDFAATANQDVVYSTVFIICSQFTKAGLLIAGAAAFRTVDAVLYAALAQGIVQCAIMVWYLHHRFPFFWRYRDRGLAAEQFRYVLPLGLAGIAAVVQTDCHNYIVANSVSTAQYAMYAVGTAPLPLFAIVREALAVVMQSRMSALQHDGRRDSMLDLLLRAWRTLGFIFVPAGVGLFFLSAEFITALYTKRYLDSVPIFAVNLILLFQSIFLIDPVVRAFAEERVWFLRIRAMIVTVQAALSFPAFQQFGITGPLWMLIAGILLERVIVLARVLPLLGFGRQHVSTFLDLVKMTGIALLAGVTVAGILRLVATDVALLRLLIGVTAFGTLYVAGILLAGVVSEEERLFVLRKLRRLVPQRVTG